MGVCVSFNIPKSSQLFAARSPVRHEGHTQTHAHIRASAHKFPLSAGGQGKVVGGGRGASIWPPNGVRKHWANKERRGGARYRKEEEEGFYQADDFRSDSMEEVPDFPAFHPFFPRPSDVAVPFLSVV